MKGSLGLAGQSQYRVMYKMLTNHVQPKLTLPWQEGAVPVGPRSTAVAPDSDKKATSHAQIFNNLAAGFYSKPKMHFRDRPRVSKVNQKCISAVYRGFLY